MPASRLMRKRASASRPRRQVGAALVVGLVLLAIITLLAVAGVNSASLELTLASNAQYRERAFQAAETGIEQTISTGKFVVPESHGEHHSNVPISASAAEKYSTTLTADLEGTPQPATWGNSWNTFSTYHFAIQSTGQSSRNTVTVHTQGIAILAPFAPSVTGKGPLN
jgi:type IV pilus assembly protein PilX